MYMHSAMQQMSISKLNLCLASLRLQACLVMFFSVYYNTSCAFKVN